MPFQILEHTADFRMKVEGKTLRELFAAAVEGMMKTMKERTAPPKKPIERRISLKAEDSTALLVDFLNEILTLAHVNKEIYTVTEWKDVTETSLAVKINGGKVEAFDKDIKAATFHQANVRKNSNGMWETNIVFDV